MFPSYTTSSLPPNNVEDFQITPHLRTTASTTVINNMQYDGVTLTKQVKNLHYKNFKPLKKKMKTISEDENISHAHGSVT